MTQQLAFRIVKRKLPRLFLKEGVGRERVNIRPDKILNNFIISVFERDFKLFKWKEYMNKGQVLCIDAIEFLTNKTSIQKELYFLLRDFTKALLLGLREKLPQDDNQFIPQFREFVERGKVIKLALKNDIVSIQEV